jgi:hypothetical protein
MAPPNLLYLRLETDTDVLVLDPLDGWGVIDFDPGDPVTREVVENNPDRDGTNDNTTYVSSRNVVMTAELVPVSSPLWEMVERLKAFNLPRKPVTLYYQTDTDAPLWKMHLRRASHSAPVANLYMQNMVLNWVCPSGLREDSTPRNQTIYAFSTDAALGRVYNRVGNRVYPASAGPVGSTNIIGGGNIDAYPVILMYGPCTGPRIENITQNKTLDFPSVVLATGEFIELDLENQTAFLNGLPDLDQAGLMDFDTSDWWTIKPGENLIRYYPVDFEPPAQAQLTWHDRWL